MDEVETTCLIENGSSVFPRIYINFLLSSRYGAVPLRSAGPDGPDLRAARLPGGRGNSHAARVSVALAAQTSEADCALGHCSSSFLDSKCGKMHFL